MVEISDEEFEKLVDQALDTIPPEIQKQVQNVALLIEDEHPENPRILGLYHGVALTKRYFNPGGKLPDTITIYRETIKRHSHSQEELVERVRKVVLHEIGHYFGLDDDELHARGY